MRYSPREHHRHSIRLPGYDYRSPGAYFVTVCTRQGECFLGEVVDGEMGLNEWGKVAWDCWQAIPDHFPHVELDAYVVMPNHVHGIVVITDGPRRGEASLATDSYAKAVPEKASRPAGEAAAGDASPLPKQPGGVQPGSLGAIVGNFKSVTARRINLIRRTPGLPVWQRNYYEHVVRDERALKAIRQYIAGNPARWAWATYNPAAVGRDSQAAELWRLLQQ